MSQQLAFEARTESKLTEPLLTADVAAELLSVRTSWIYDAARRGELPCIRVGKHVRFLRTDLEGWVIEQRQVPQRAT